jgi:hypothetical protein
LVDDDGHKDPKELKMPNKTVSVCLRDQEEKPNHKRVFTHFSWKHKKSSNAKHDNEHCSRDQTNIRACQANNQYT